MEQQERGVDPWKFLRVFFAFTELENTFINLGDSKNIEMSSGRTRYKLCKKKKLDERNSEYCPIFDFFFKSLQFLLWMVA